MLTYLYKCARLKGTFEREKLNKKVLEEVNGLITKIQVEGKEEDLGHLELMRDLTEIPFEMDQIMVSNELVRQLEKTEFTLDLPKSGVFFFNIGGEDLVWLSNYADVTGDDIVYRLGIHSERILFPMAFPDDELKEKSDMMGGLFTVTEATVDKVVHYYTHLGQPDLRKKPLYQDTKKAKKLKRMIASEECFFTYQQLTLGFAKDRKYVKDQWETRTHLCNQAYGPGFAYRRLIERQGHINKRRK